MNKKITKVSLMKRLLMRVKQTLQARRSNKIKRDEQPLTVEQAMQQREQQQAIEQWLRRIPDDPAGLWRRNFNINISMAFSQECEAMVRLFLIAALWCALYGHMQPI